MRIPPGDDYYSPNLGPSSVYAALRPAECTSVVRRVAGSNYTMRTSSVESFSRTTTASLFQRLANALEPTVARPKWLVTPSQLSMQCHVRERYPVVYFVCIIIVFIHVGRHGEVTRGFYRESIVSERSGPRTMCQNDSLNFASR